MYRFLIVLNISLMLGLQTWRTLFNNFAVEVANLEGYHVGVIQSVREIPGFMAILVVLLLMLIKEYRLSALSILTLGIGVAATGLFPSFSWLFLTTMVGSIGFHFFDTTSRSLTLQYFDKSVSPWVFGKIRSYSAASNIVTGVLIYLMSKFFNFTKIYMLIGCIVIAVGAWSYFQNPADKSVAPQHNKMIFRMKYWLYYCLTFMDGARR